MKGHVLQVFLARRQWTRKLRVPRGTAAKLGSGEEAPHGLLAMARGEMQLPAKTSGLWKPQL